MQAHAMDDDARIDDAIALTRDRQRDQIDTDDVFIETRIAADLQTPPGGLRSLAQEVDRAEKAAIEQALARNEGQIEKVARELAVSTTTLWRKMKRLGLRKD